MSSHFLKFCILSFISFLSFMNLANAFTSVAVFHPNISNPNLGKDVITFYNSSGDITFVVPLTSENPSLVAGAVLSNPSRAKFRDIDCTPASFTVGENTELRADVSVDPNSKVATCAISILRP